MAHVVVTVDLVEGAELVTEVTLWPVNTVLLIVEHFAVLSLVLVASRQLETMSK